MFISKAKPDDSSSQVSFLGDSMSSSGIDPTYWTSDLPGAPREPNLIAIAAVFGVLSTLFTIARLVARTLGKTVWSATDYLAIIALAGAWSVSGLTIDGSFTQVPSFKTEDAY